MDGADLYSVLEGHFSLLQVLEAKRRHLNETGEPLFSSESDLGPRRRGSLSAKEMAHQMAPKANTGIFLKVSVKNFPGQRWWAVQDLNL